MANIIIDLTPVLPGGENGGAKLMVLSLIKSLAKISPTDNFILLTASSSHQELATLDSFNIRRICVLRRQKNVVFLKESWKKFKNKLFCGNYNQTLLGELKADLLFCPFTAPFYGTKGIPIVSIIYDLQYLDCPYFFSSEDQYHRNMSFQNASQSASYLVCISEFTRHSVLKNSPTPLDPEKVVTIPIHLPPEYAQLHNCNITQMLTQYNLQQENFLLYPANFWKHKNHKILLTAFARYCHQYPHSTLKLVCTGAPSENQKDLIYAVEKIGLSSRIIFPGYIPFNVLSGLFFSCRALVFPSLYEGFGIPIVEAMLAGKPIICSNKGSIPEVGKNAVFYFDPTKLHEIFNAIYQVDQHLDTFDSRILLAYKYAQDYLQIEKMAAAYHHLFQKAIYTKQYHSAIQGVFEDNWTSEIISLSYKASKEIRQAEIMLSCPEFHPKDLINICIIDSRAPKQIKNYTLQKGESLTIKHPLKTKKGHLRLSIQDVFQPSAHNMGEDNRILGCLFHGYNITSTQAG